MKIKAIECSILKSTGNFENKKIGAYAEVEEGETPEKALVLLQIWIMEKFAVAAEEGNLTYEIDRLESKKRELLSDISRGSKLRAQLREVLVKHMGEEFVRSKFPEYAELDEPF